MGQQWPAAGLGALSAWDLLKKVAIIFITSTMVWSHIKQQGGNTTLALNIKLHYRFTEQGLTHQNKTKFPPMVSLSHHEASISLLSLSFRE